MCLVTVAPRGPTVSLELTGLLWADESFLVLCLCVGRRLLGLAALLLLLLAAALALHAVPHAVTKVDEEA